MTIAGPTQGDAARADVCVIGGGIAGAAAALSARACGKSVVLISKAPGATALWSGTLDVACAADPSGRTSTLDAAHVLATAKPLHPYARLGVEGLARAIDFFSPSRFGMEGPGLRAAPLVVATELGAIKPAPFAAPSIAAGALVDGQTIGVASLVGYPRFDARACARTLETLSLRAGRRQTARPLPIALPTRAGVDPSAAEVARSLDTEASLERLAAAIRGAAADAGAHVVLLPPALPAAAPARLSMLSGVRCGELCADAGSLFGMRLWERMREVVRAEGISMVVARVSGFDAGTTRVREVELEGHGSIAADAFVLASGKFIGGGLRRDDRFRETVFDLPVFWNDTVVGYVDVLKLTAPQPWNEQRLFACGLHTDPHGRPVRGDRRPAFENLFAAGSVLTGYDADAEGSGFGVAISTGYAAGRHAAGAPP